ncbi:glucosaminidase domain-containing protein [Campylobacter sp. US33a]|uniref:glucosaminidase domain-containing protein n=1 Tax=Campylobacter sp. US33a TaxID=2498120 RepID=UPI001067EA56|nr:glucosaminidase domain-containing protein [Campylobacter sp. US33a]TEY02037.1 mannosyl-glycoprotein endo-beta-N-acetylglucosamidase [Campylobacter sp. US33a]
MRQIIIFLSLFPLMLFSIEKNGFGENYYQLNIKEKQQVFFEKMNQMFDISFGKLQKELEFVESFLKEGAKSGFRDLNPVQFSRLIEIKNKYRVEKIFDLEDYQKRIGVIPKSMGIAQALVESGTGTSRFAREANNLFGEWTWSEKGLTPNARLEGKTHKIRIFDTLQESVDSYVLNLNRHAAYADFRKAREEFAKQGKMIDGISAIQTLDKYSETGKHYIEVITKIIKKHNLEKYDYN